MTEFNERKTLKNITPEEFEDYKLYVVVHQLYVSADSFAICLALFEEFLSSKHQTFLEALSYCAYLFGENMDNYIKEHDTEIFKVFRHIFDKEEPEACNAVAVFFLAMAGHDFFSRHQHEMKEFFGNFADLHDKSASAANKTLFKQYFSKHVSEISGEPLAESVQFGKSVYQLSAREFLLKYQLLKQVLQTDFYFQEVPEFVETIGCEVTTTTSQNELKKAQRRRRRIQMRDKRGY